MSHLSQQGHRPRHVADAHGGFKPIGDLFPELLTDILRAHQGRKIDGRGTSRADAFPPDARVGMHPIDKQAARAHQPPFHDGAAQAADRGTHAHECASGGGGNPVSSDGGALGSMPSVSVRSTAGCLPANLKFAVALPDFSRSLLPVDLHVRRFAHAVTFDAYLRVWSAAGFDISFDGPHSAFMAKRQSLNHASL